MAPEAPPEVVVDEAPSLRTAISAWGVLLLLTVLLFILLTAGNAITRRPWSDEGWFSNAAYELRYHGFMGTTALETAGTKLTGINRRTYWILPLYPVAEAGWFALFGFSLFTARAFSMFWGLLAVAACFGIVRALTGRLGIAAVAATLAAMDYQFLLNASFARYDMMAASLGLLGIAVYLHWRQSRFTAALVGGETLVAASCFTHFLGVLHFAGLLALVVALDRKRVRFGHLLLSALPYAAGLIAWGAYILQSPQDFVNQFTLNATTGGRLQNILAPWRGIRDEVVKRYLVAYGLAPQTSAQTAPASVRAFKIAPLLAYVAGIILAVCTPLRRRPECRVLLGLAAIYAAIMCVLDGQKLSYYVIHIVPLFAAVLAVSLFYVRERRLVPAWAAAGLCLALCALQAGGIAYRMRQNTRADYEDAARFLKATLHPADTVMASAEMGFAIGFDRVRDDIRLGFHSGATPAYIVLEEVYDINIAYYRQQEPALAAFIGRRLDTEYAEVFRNRSYRVYRRNPDSGGAR